MVEIGTGAIVSKSEANRLMSQGVPVVAGPNVEKLLKARTREIAALICNRCRQEEKAAINPKSGHYAHARDFGEEVGTIYVLCAADPVWKAHPEAL